MTYRRLYTQNLVFRPVRTMQAVPSCYEVLFNTPKRYQSVFGILDILVEPSTYILIYDNKCLWYRLTHSWKYPTATQLCWKYPK